MVFFLLGHRVYWKSLGAEGGSVCAWGSSVADGKTLVKTGVDLLSLLLLSYLQGAIPYFVSGRNKIRGQGCCFGHILVWRLFF